jgi:L,D-peptidoglycan transpeptidase YkuD (ErfK/YbiS/YcfS/YnhG family)
LTCFGCRTSPRLITNTRRNHKQAMLSGGEASLKWVKPGSYWMDADNMQKHPGYNFFNLRVNYHPVKRDLKLLGSITI